MKPVHPDISYLPSHYRAKGGLGMVAYVFDPITKEVDLCEFKANEVYIASSRTSQRATGRLHLVTERTRVGESGLRTGRLKHVS